MFNQPSVTCICVLLPDRQYKSTHYAYAFLIYRIKFIQENNLNHCRLYCRSHWKGLQPESRGPVALWRCIRPLVHGIPLGHLRCSEIAMLVGVAPNALPGVPESHLPVGQPWESAEGFRAWFQHSDHCVFLSNTALRTHGRYIRYTQSGLRVAVTIVA